MWEPAPALQPLSGPHGSLCRLLAALGPATVPLTGASGPGRSPQLWLARLPSERRPGPCPRSGPSRPGSAVGPASRCPGGRALCLLRGGARPGVPVVRATLLSGRALCHMAQRRRAAPGLAPSQVSVGLSQDTGLPWELAPPGGAPETCRAQHSAALSGLAGFTCFARGSRGPARAGQERGVGWGGRG